MSYRWSWLCESGKESVECSAEKTVCGDWIAWNWEDCDNCSKDVKDPCVDEWKPECGNWKVDDGETCKTCPKDVKDPCVDEWKPKCGNWKVDDGETCKTCPKDVKDPCVDEWKPKCGNWKVDDGEDCKTCPKDMKDPCVDYKEDPDVPNIIINDCGNGKIDEGETCETCPVDFGWCVKPNNECNSCPCEYVDFSTNLTKWDTVRAKLWDKLWGPALYNYSNSVDVERFIK